MKSRISHKPSVRTSLKLSLRWKVAIGVGIFTIIAGVALIIVLNTGTSTITKADNKSATGPSSNCAYFDGTSDSYIDFGRGKNLECIKNLPNGNKMSITMWVKWDNLSNPGVGNWANLFTLSDSVGSGDNGIFWVQHNQANTKFEFALSTTNGGRQFIQSTTTPVAGTWYHIACVYNGSPSQKKMYLYVNGVLETIGTNASGNIAAFSNAAKLNMGRWSNPQNNYRHFNGNIDEVSIWNVALSATEISNMINNPSLVLGSTFNASGLIGYWNFDDLTANSLCACENNGVSGSGVTLPVELLSFTAKKDNSDVVLKWSTATEINNDYFLIERSSDMESFETIGTVEGAGNSNELLHYAFTDTDLKDPICYYRLKQVDYDGAYAYSSVVVISTEGDSPLGEITIGPNPFIDHVNFNYTAIASGTIELLLYDMSGKVVSSESVEVTEGMNTLVLSIDAGLPSGYYLAGVRQNGESTTLTKLAKAK